VEEPTRIGGGNVGLSDDVEALVAFEGRRAGTDAERRAAGYLRERLENLGRQVRVEPTRIWTGFALAQLLHTVVAIVGSVLSVYVPVAGFALVLLAAISTFGDLTGSYFLGRLPFGARASQNVVSVEDEDKLGRLVLVASYDARRGGALFGERLRRWPSVYFWSILLVLACATPRLLGLDATWLTAIQFAGTVVLIAMTPLFVDAALADTEQGANWNASGAATVLQLAERYGGKLEHFDLIVVLTGASHPTPLGMRAWLRRHGHALDAQATVILAIESAAHGTPHYATKEGLVFPTRLHPTLIEAVREMEIADPFIARSQSAAYPARSSGLPALRISALGARDFAPDTVDEEALARTYDFLCELVERLDEQVGPQLG